MFTFRCKHCIVLHYCMDCSKGKNPLELRRVYDLYEQYKRDRHAARQEKVRQLNDELHAELRHELRNKY